MMSLPTLVQAVIYTVLFCTLHARALSRGRNTPIFESRKRNTDQPTLTPFDRKTRMLLIHLRWVKSWKSAVDSEGFTFVLQLSTATSSFCQNVRRASNCRYLDL